MVYTSHLPHLPAELRGLEDLALDLRWAWSREGADEIWSQLDPEVWALTRNPWLILQTLSPSTLESLAKDDRYLKKLRKHHKEWREELEASRWFEEQHPGAALKTVAYLSLEFGLSEALPIYSGGLGVLAGDHLKAASDMGVPIVGVGLLYQRGYFRQGIGSHGEQLEFYPYNDPSQLPVRPLRDSEGEWMRFSLPHHGRTIWLRPWEVRIGRVHLYLLDSNDPLNEPADRGITSELYGGGTELRLQQECVLGIGGWYLLRRLGIEPDVCHLNEGHAAFAVLERARSFMEDHRVAFDVALAATRAGNLFTTHTPVAAGFDRFQEEMIRLYLGDYCRRLGIGVRGLMELGRANPENPHEPFNMAFLAIRGSGAVNGVSTLHGRVSRELFRELFPRWPASEIPITSVTNGVHVPTWESANFTKLREKYATGQTSEERWPTEELWQARSRQRLDLLIYARLRAERQLASEGQEKRRLEEARRMFDPNALTLGFARRFATYKRPDLLLHDPERLARLLTNPWRPVQLIIAGKAHPADHPGKAVIKAWTDFSRRSDVRMQVIFLSDYDMLLTERLVQGVDVWLNTPRPPWEACGTSGMKVVSNGGLNLSSLDGWWANAYSPELGWALTDDREYASSAEQDAADANRLYELLEHEIVPLFYNRDDRGIPLGWVDRIRASLEELSEQYSAARMVREYTDRFYVPGAERYSRLAQDNAQAGQNLIDWLSELELKWRSVHFGNLESARADDGYELKTQVYLGELDPESVIVEVYAEGKNGDLPFRAEMERCERLAGILPSYAYTVRVPNHRPLSDYTPRVVPRQLDATVPLEAPFILWQN